MRHKLSEQGDPKTEQRILNTVALLVPLLPHKKRFRPQILLAFITSILIHGVLVFIMAPKLDTLVLTPKKSLEAGLTFKPVVLIEPLNNIKPKKARHFAEQDQSAKREQIAKYTSTMPLKALALAPAQEDKIKHINRAFKTPTANDFLRKTRREDPLGLKVPPTGVAGAQALPFNEHMPHISQGEHTELNTWVWRHAPFFNRIKMRIGQVWSPNRQIARYDPEGLLLGQQDRVTVMSVTIDKEGKLKTLAVANSSGIAYLDEEAERAFKKAAPFPYPPKALFNSKEGFTFQFAFHLQMNRAVKFDFEWHQAD